MVRKVRVTATIAQRRLSIVSGKGARQISQLDSMVNFEKQVALTIRAFWRVCVFLHIHNNVVSNLFLINHKHKPNLTVSPLNPTKSPISRILPHLLWRWATTRRQRCRANCSSRTRSCRRRSAPCSRWWAAGSPRWRSDARSPAAAGRSCASWAAVGASRSPCTPGLSSRRRSLLCSPSVSRTMAFLWRVSESVSKVLMITNDCGLKRIFNFVQFLFPQN